MFAADGKAKSNCTGSCATYWPPFTAAGKVVAGGSAQAGDLATIPRSGGTRQVTYAGHPLYYYVGDHHAGDTAGQGSNGSGAKWWVLAPSGAPITSSGHGGGRASSSSSSSSSGGGGSWG
jgi:predicted lipoprotein with Yx(FWY)xxD motif